MTKFVFLTDSHFRTKTPVNRTDDILETQLRKLEHVLEYAAEIDAHIIHGGDMFHNPSPPDIVANSVVRLFKKYKRECYFIIGNHDVVGSNPDAAPYAKIGLASEFEWFHLINRKGIMFGNCYLTGFDFSKEKECPEEIMLGLESLHHENIPIICCVHCMITDQPQVCVEKKLKTINWKTVRTDASLILCGHYHPGIGIQENILGTLFVNPGAMIRLEASQVDATRKPQFAIITVDDKKNIDVKLSIIPHDKHVFDLEKVTDKKYSEEEINRFMDALSELSDEDLMGDNILNVLEKLDLNKLPQEIKKELTEEVLAMCKGKVTEIINEQSN